jgi:hypothetical protein
MAWEERPLLTNKKPKLTLEKFLQAKHISIRAEGTTYANADEALQGRGSAGQQRKVRLLMSGFF